MSATWEFIGAIGFCFYKATL